MGNLSVWKQAISVGVTAVLDAMGACFFSVYAMVMGPLGVLRGPLALERIFYYFWVMLPLGVLTKAIRVAIDWRLGFFDLALVQCEGLISVLVYAHKKNPHSRAQRIVLLDLYTVLSRAYLHTGRIDEAMQVLLRVHQNLGVERLDGLPQLDVRTAQIIRAGLAASKMLEGGGLATLMLTAPHRPATMPRAGSSAAKPPSTGSDPVLEQGAKIIPFPKR